MRTIRDILMLPLLLALAACTQQPTAPASAEAAIPAEALPSCTRSPPIVDRWFGVFFPDHTAVLSDRSRRVLDDLVAAKNRGDGLFISLSGHTDTGETGPGDRGLGMRRAEAVARYLEERGIDRARIGMEDYGVSRLLVPTPPGTSEPQNRRVEISPVGLGSAQAYRERQQCAAWVLRSCVDKPPGQFRQECSTALTRLGNDPFP